MSRKLAVFILFMAFLSTAMLSGTARAADYFSTTESEYYCTVPAYVQRGLDPNILIIQDNSEITGGPAYRVNEYYYIEAPDAAKTAFYNYARTNYAAAITTRYTANSSATSSTALQEFNWDVFYTRKAEGMQATDKKYLVGYFEAEIMYDYANPTFDPDASGLFSGAMLNWATTSRYDLIQDVLIGGKASSRQTNPNTLYGYNAGYADIDGDGTEDDEWPTKTYIYNGTDGTYYACDIVINDGGHHYVTFNDSVDTWTLGYFSSILGYAPKCGLIKTSPIGPQSSADMPGDGTRYARMDAPRHGIVDVALGYLDTLLGLAAGEAEAAVVKCNDGGTQYNVPSTAMDFDSAYMTPPNGTQSTAYVGHSFSAYGGLGDAYQWTITSGSLPSGYAMDTDGYISGTTSLYGTYNFTVTLQDCVSWNNGTKVCDKWGTITSSGTLECVNNKTQAVSLTIIQTPLSITSPASGGTLYDAIPNVAYQGYQAYATGGLPPYTWSIYNTSGGALGHPRHLPTGLSINSTTGYISGTTTETLSSLHTIGIMVTDSLGSTATVSPVYIWVYPYCSPMSIQQPASGATLTAYNDVAYSGYTPSAFCGLPPFTWTISGLPSGLIYNSTTGSITGTPSDTAGNYSVTFTITDSFTPQNSASRTVTVSLQDITITSKNYNIRVCIGDYSDNCNTHTRTDALRGGLLPDYWEQAQFGMIDFDASLDPNLAVCTSSGSTQSSFFTQVQNSVPRSGISKLGDAEYGAIDLFANGAQNISGLGNCEPFRLDNALDDSPCRNNFILMLTSGEGATQGTSVFDSTSHPVLPTLDPDCTAPGGFTNTIAINACAGDQDLRNTTNSLAASPYNDIVGTQNAATYVVNAMGENDDILKAVALYSGGNYYDASDPSTLKQQLQDAFADILKKAASGTAASVLASGEGSGANLLQAVYYPRRQFYDSQTETYTEIKWIGRLANFWYYVDPLFANNSIREESDTATYPMTMDLSEDWIMSLEAIEVSSDELEVYAFRQMDDDGDGDPSGSLPVGVANQVEFEKAGSIWEAGLLLWERDIDTDPRTIYTSDIVGSTNTLIAFENSASFTSDSNVQAWLQATDAANAQDIIDFAHGYEVDTTNYRSRAVRVDLNGDGDTLDAGETVQKVWKLGDILNSTPKVSTWIQLANYDTTYSDSSYYNELAHSGFVNSSTYVNRGVVFAGANDGMLHAFRLGKLELSWTGQSDTEKSRLTGSDLGEELWAFIPKHALPYLKTMMNTDYCHIYTVDLTPTVIDASIAFDADDDDGVSDGDGTPDAQEGAANCTASDYHNCKRTSESWRTIVIGGMRFGGGCREPGVSGTQDLNADGSTDEYDTVQVPAAGMGYSEYFALDVTDPENPSLLWEFSNQNMGFSFGGPTIIRLNSKQDGNDSSDTETSLTNGKWYVVFGSGPTGPLYHQGSLHMNLANSDQNLKIFVLDLATGSLEATLDTTIQNAYSGSLLNANNDPDRDYDDDVMYIPYIKKCATSSGVAGFSCVPDEWNDGGIGRLMTHRFSNGGWYSELTPTSWVFKKFMDNIGPVVSATGRLTNIKTNKMWVFAGTGRYFYKRLDDDTNESIPDDAASQRAILATTDPCFNTQQVPFLDQNCASTRAPADLEALNLASTAGATNPNGWYALLDTEGSYGGVDFAAERVVTDLLPTTTGILYVTSFQPYEEECKVGGGSYIWAFKYDDGASAESLLKGQVLMQVSTGAIEQVNLADAFTEKGKRRSSKLEGQPPMAQGFSLFAPPEPEEKILHIIEREW